MHMTVATYQCVLLGIGSSDRLPPSEMFPKLIYRTPTKEGEHTRRATVAPEIAQARELTFGWPKVTNGHSEAQA